MDVGENRVRVFYGTGKREKEKDSRYIQEASAPSVGPCIRLVTSCTSVTYTVAYMVYLPEIQLMGSAGLMYNLLKMMVVADSAGDAR
jgi:hypothetical protein